MRSYTIAVLSVLLAAGAVQAQAGPAPKEAAKRDLQRLQGGWHVLALETDGVKKTAADLKEHNVFIGAEAFLVRDGKKVIQVAKLKLDPTKRPKSVNANVIQGDGVGDVLLGIYEIKGDTLRICFDMEGQKRPVEFKTTAKSGFTLVECKRIPFADQGLPDITGPYKSASPDPNGNPQTSDATIERRGDAYLVSYHKNGVLLYVGIGMRRGDLFSMCWAAPNNQFGLSIYQIEKGPRLVGQYTVLNGIGMLSQEILTAKDKSD